MKTRVIDLSVGDHVKGVEPDDVFRIENIIATPGGLSIRFTKHGVLTDFAEYNPYDSFERVTMH